MKQNLQKAMNEIKTLNMYASTMEYKTTLKEIKRFNAVDITLHQDIYKLKEEESGFVNICYSKGACGWNGQVVKGNKTGTYYKIVGRASNLFAL